jgi:hypothetical protein
MIRAKMYTSGRVVFDKQAKRKPLAFAADAISYGFECHFGTHGARSRLLIPRSLWHAHLPPTETTFVYYEAVLWRHKSKFH